MAAKTAKSYSFADFQAEANRDRKPTEPFVINDVDPPLSIEPPTTLDQQVALSELVSIHGDFEMKDARKILEAFCGDAFPRLYALLKDKHVAVFGVVANAMIEHFRADLDPEAAMVPGGSGASLT